MSKLGENKKQETAGCIQELQYSFLCDLAGNEWYFGVLESLASHARKLNYAFQIMWGTQMVENKRRCTLIHIKEHIITGNT